MGGKLSNPLWSAKEIAEATNGQILGDFTSNGVEIDSRAVSANDLFIALKVERDGHDFVQMALEKGASGALIHNKGAVHNAQGAVLCQDTMLGLENMGAYARRRATITKRVAVTGSVGKTTVKELTAAALSASGKIASHTKGANSLEFCA